MCNIFFKRSNMLSENNNFMNIIIIKITEYITSNATQ